MLMLLTAATDVYNTTKFTPQLGVN